MGLVSQVTDIETEINEIELLGLTKKDPLLDPERLLRDCLKKCERLLFQPITEDISQDLIDESLDKISNLGDRIGSLLESFSIKSGAILGSARSTLYTLPLSDNIIVKPADFKDADLGFQTWGAGIWMALAWDLIAATFNSYGLQASIDDLLFEISKKEFSHSTQPSEEIEHISLINRKEQLINLKKSIKTIMEFIYEKTLNLDLSSDEVITVPFKILELGTGTGIVGLVLDRIIRKNLFNNLSINNKRVNLDLTVVLTDYNPTVVNNIKRNLENNSIDTEIESNVEVYTLDWRFYRDEDGSTSEHINELSKDANTKFDLILACDCIYEMEHSYLVGKVARQYLKPDGRFWTIWPLRERWFKESEVFIKQCLERYNCITSEEIEDNDHIRMTYKSCVYKL